MDVPRFNVGEHPFRFRMFEHRFSADAFKVVHLDDVPTLRFGIVSGAFFMVLRALAAGLILGRDANPDADRSRSGFPLWFILLSGKCHGGAP